MCAEASFTKNNSQLRYFYDFFPRVLLRRIQQFFCQKIIAADDYFLVKLASGPD